MAKCQGLTSCASYSTGAPDHPQLGHEQFGEVVEVGPDVEFVKVKDVVRYAFQIAALLSVKASIPFNAACGRCRNCKRGFSNACEYTNPKQPGGGYGYVGVRRRYDVVHMADSDISLVAGPVDSRITT